jgi:hypothetical protein
MYEPGQVVKQYCRIFPASVLPWIPPLPIRESDKGIQSVMLCAIVTEQYLTVAWQAGQTIHRVDIAINPAEAATVNSQGGTVGGFTIKSKHGCRCNANLLNGFDPFPGVDVIAAGAASTVRDPDTYGLIPPRVKYVRI